eukprot:TRINITY_DN6510_c0_g1_i1.p1 TRINITY_DN6510_c0_g1~~TRINITY_DN6510_c0_g1_i1.p1  ORF type:complete len:858 (-),score=206.22 TRINITY_DN6510_c0_g1_i1:287-2602(-)
MWACAQLGLKDPHFVETVLNISQSKLQWFKPQELSNLLWALAKLEGGKEASSSPEHEVFGRKIDGILFYVIQSIDEFTPQGIANTWWSLATLSHHRDHIVEGLMPSLRRRLPHLNAQEISNIFWSLAKLQVKDVSILASMKEYLYKHIPSFTEQHVANIMWGLAKFAESESGVDMELIDEIVSKFYATVGDRIVKFNSQELSMVVWAISVVGTDCSERKTGGQGSAGSENSVGAETAQNLLIGCKKCAKHFNAHQLSLILLGFAKLGLYDEDFLVIFGRFATKKINDFKAQDLSNAAWGFARLDFKAPEFFAAVISQAIKQLSSVCSCYDKYTQGDSVTCAHFSEFTPQHLSNLIWSVAKIGIKPSEVSELCSIVAFRMTPLIGKFKARDISNAFWGFATLGIYPGQIVTDLANAGKKKFSEFNSQEMLKFLWSVEKSGVVDKELDEAVSKGQKLTYELPFLDQTSTPRTISLSSQAPGRKLRGTGVAAWEASFVLAEWLTRHKSPMNDEYISQILKEFDPRIKKMPGKEADGFPGDRALDLETNWKTWKGKRCVEIGAGLGLPSIVASLLGMRVVSTDGDADVIALLSENVTENVTTDPHKKNVRVNTLLWGNEDPKKELGIECCPDLLMAADVVYGNSVQVWRQLVDTLVKLSDHNTLLLVSQVQRYKKGEDTFFKLLGAHFHATRIPQSCLHEEYRKQGPGTCQIWAYRKKKESEVTEAHISEEEEEEKAEEVAEVEEEVVEKVEEVRLQKRTFQRKKKRRKRKRWQR